MNVCRSLEDPAPRAPPPAPAIPGSCVRAGKALTPRRTAKMSHVLAGFRISPTAPELDTIPTYVISLKCAVSYRSR